jgi:Flp pilus assembly protein TadB
MPLDDREQRILEEIERQFYEDDPRLAETVRTAGLAAGSRRRLKWALLGLVCGVALMLVFFTTQTLVALAGFVLMVLSVAWIIAIARRRSGVASVPAWRDRLHRRSGSGRRG